MLIFLICLATVIVLVFAVLAYGAINDGQRILFTGIAVFFLVWVAVLGLVLALSGNSPSEQKAEGLQIPTVKVPATAPKAPDAVQSANLPLVAVRGMSFHLEPRESTPIFRIPIGKTIHVSVYGGALTSYSGGVVKLSCDTRSFSIMGTGDGGTQLVACDSRADVLIDDVRD